MPFDDEDAVDDHRVDGGSGALGLDITGARDVGCPYVSGARFRSTWSLPILAAATAAASALHLTRRRREELSALAGKAAIPRAVFVELGALLPDTQTYVTLAASAQETR